jgi:hypothetical protein
MTLLEIGLLGLLLRFYHYQTNEATHSPLLLTWRATFPLQRGRGRENDPSCPCIFSECLLSYFLAMTSGPHTQDLSSTSRASADCYALARPRTAPGARGGGDGYRGRRDRAPRQRRHGSRAAGLTSGSASKMESERLIATSSGRCRVSHSGRGRSRREACARAASRRRRARPLARVRASEDQGVGGVVGRRLRAATSRGTRQAAGRDLGESPA